MTTAEFFHRVGEEARPPVRYVGCGLEGIFLCNGYETDEFEGETVLTVKDREGLHRAIALHIVQHRKLLSPDEIRFFRRIMDLTQAELGKLLRTGSQTVARWEKGQVDIPGVSDLLLRLLLLAECLSPDEFKKVAQQLPSELEDLDDAANEPVVFHHGDHWAEAA